MKKGRHIYYLIILGWAITIPLILMPMPVAACSPTPTPEGFSGYATEADRVRAVPVVLEGIIVATFKTDNAYIDNTVKVEVQQYLKGNGPKTVIVKGFGGGVDCLPVALVGTHAIFYLLGDPAVELGLSHDYPFSSIVSHFPNPTMMAEITSAAGQTPIVPMQRSGTTVIVQWLAVLTMSGILIGIGYQKYTKTKQKGH